MSKEEMVSKILERFSEQQLARKLATYHEWQGWTKDEAVECIYYSIFDPEKAKMMAAEKRRKQMEADMRKLAEAVNELSLDVELKKMENVWKASRHPMTEADYM